jgi:hypothetical protein
MVPAAMKKVGDRLGADPVALKTVADALLHRIRGFIHRNSFQVRRSRARSMPGRYGASVYEVD